MSEVRVYDFTPADFGAIGDGVTDCAEAFQKSGHYVRANDYHEAQSQLAALREELAKFDEGMRALACSLGAGGYNAETLTADQLVGKVQWGIDNIVTVQEQRLADAERRNAELTQALERGKLWVELFRSWFGDYGVSAEDHQMIIRTLRSLPHPPNEFDAAINPKPEAASHD